MAIEPSDRYRSAAELHSALRLAEDGMQASALQVGSPGNYALLDTDRARRLSIASQHTWYVSQWGGIAVIVLAVCACAYAISVSSGRRELSRDNVELLFDSSNIAPTPIRARALLEYISDEKAAGPDQQIAPVGHSGSKGKVNLYRVQLQGVRLGYNINLTQCCFIEANLSKAEMNCCYFSETVFVEADLSNVSMHGSDFRAADFTEANLTGGDFPDANFTAARFEKTNLAGTRLIGACIADVTNWNGASLDDARLDMAVVESGDWIERVAPGLKNPAALDGWKVEMIPKGTVLPDERYHAFEYWLRPAE